MRRFDLTEEEVRLLLTLLGNADNALMWEDRKWRKLVRATQRKLKLPDAA